MDDSLIAIRLHEYSLDNIIILFIWSGSKKNSSEEFTHTYLTERNFNET